MHGHISNASPRSRNAVTLIIDLSGIDYGINAAHSLYCNS